MTGLQDQKASAVFYRGFLLSTIPTPPCHQTARRRLFPCQTSERHPQPRCARSPSQREGLGRLVLIPGWRTGFSFEILRQDGPSKLLVGFLGCSANSALLRWSLPGEGGWLCRDGSLLPGTGTGPVPPHRPCPAGSVLPVPPRPLPTALGECWQPGLNPESLGWLRAMG